MQVGPNHKATLPPVIAGGTDTSANNRLYTDECLKTVKARVISHFLGTAFSVHCGRDERIKAVC